MKERSLVLFTLLMQTAASAYLVPIGMQLWFGDSLSGFDTTLLFRVVFWLVMGLSILGLLASFLHLGSARNAWYALSNLRSSWLSREIFFSLLFTSGVSLFSVLGANTRPGLAMAALFVITGLSGLALVYCMSRIYRLRTVPSWNSPVTGLSFWTTTLLLGGITSIASFYLTALYVINYQASLPMLAELEWRNELVTLITPLTYLALTLILIQVLLTSKHLPQKSHYKKDISGKHKPIASLRQWFLGLGGSGLLLTILFLHNPSPSISTIASLVIASWLCIVAGETLRKTAFYEARRQPGLVYPELPWSSNPQD